MINRFFLCLFPGMLMASSLACGSGNKETTTTQTPVSTGTMETTEATPELTASFPKEVTILLPTQYRKENGGYPKDVETKDWYVFYKDENTGKFIFEKEKPKISYSYDECVGQDVMVIGSKHENAVFFFTSFEGLSKTADFALEDQPLFPKSITPFQLNGNGYRLSALGSAKNNEGQYIPESRYKQMADDDKTDLIVSDYRLSIIDLATNLETELTRLPELEYSLPKLIWAGDLNRDGLPDLIIDLPDFYESTHLFFFLSDAADADHPFKKVADLLVVNDC